jgi:hypothetical protein
MHNPAASVRDTIEGEDPTSGAAYRETATLLNLETGNWSNCYASCT